MKTSLADPGWLSVLRWHPHFIPTILLAMIISACGGGGGGSETVNQVGLGSVTLAWVPPTQNSDGSPLTDLAGYKFYYGNESGNYRESVQIDNPGITLYVIQNLTPNTYFFVLTAIDSNGVESQFSNEASKQVL